MAIFYLDHFASTYDHGSISLSFGIMRRIPFASLVCGICILTSMSDNTLLWLIRSRHPLRNRLRSTYAPAVTHRASLFGSSPRLLMRAAPTQDPPAHGSKGRANDAPLGRYARLGIASRVYSSWASRTGESLPPPAVLPRHPHGLLILALRLRSEQQDFRRRHVLKYAIMSS